MESLPKHKYLEFNPDTFINVRKEFNLDKQERMVEAIDILEDWIKKQNHFVKKDFSREYLERTLITTKGLVERAKTRIDNLCTFRTLMPDFFQDIDIQKCALSHLLSQAILPKLTADDLRIYTVKVYKDNFTFSECVDFFKYIVIMGEYLKTHDYCKGFHLVFDYREINVVNILTKVNPVNLRQAVTLLMDGYSMSLKGLHFITPSKMVNMVFAMLSPIFSAKLMSRIHIHKDLDTLYDYIPKNILPIEFGGYERSLKQLHVEYLDIMDSEEYKQYLKEMNKATTDESRRQSGKFNEQYLGIPGSFRTLSVD